MPRPLKMPAEAAEELPARLRVLLFCAASGTDWQHQGIPGETVASAIIDGLIVRDATGDIELTDRGRALLRALLTDL